MCNIIASHVVYVIVLLICHLTVLHSVTTLALPLMSHSLYKSLYWFVIDFSL